MTMIIDKKGFVWLGAYGALLKYNPLKNELSKIEMVSEEKQETSSNVLSLLEDRTGIIWVGFSLGGGICKIESNKIKFNIIKQKKSE